MSIEENDVELDIEPNDVLEQEPPSSDDFEPTPIPTESEEDEKGSYSKRVQKRIDKLAYERNVERSKREALEQKLADQEERIKALSDKQQKHFDEINTNSLEQQKKNLLSRRRDALEIGDYDDINTIDEQLLDIKIKAQVVDKSRDIPREQTPPREPHKPEPQAYVPEAMIEWQRRNQWAQDPNQAARLAKADAIYFDLLDKGYDPEEQEIYEEIDKRMKRQSPPPGDGPDRGRITGSEKTAFTAQDKRDMENWGLNPNDPIARKEWIKQKAGI